MERMKKIIYLLLISLMFCISKASALDSEVAYLAATLYGEARGEGVEGMQIVASTILNRRNFYQQRAKKGQVIKISDVCLAYKQYSYWNDKQSWTPQRIEQHMKSVRGSDAAAWQKCLKIANLAVSGKLQDNTGGAMNYYATWMDKKGVAPSWARKYKTAVVGKHRVVYGVSMAGLRVHGKVIAGGGAAPGGSGNLASSNLDLGNDSYSSSTPAGEYEVGDYTMPSQCGAPPSYAPYNGGGVVQNDVNTSEFFSMEILDNMQSTLLTIYQSMGVLFMLGHALMCYATEAAYTCIGGEGSGVQACLFTVPNLQYYPVGLIIYLTGFFMCMSIGMYFIDISFKLGFALLFLPITIGLWPFPVVNRKFNENISIIVYNAMLFAFISIGAAYAIVLITQGIIGDQQSWNQFWQSINASTDIAEGREGLLNIQIGGAKVGVFTSQSQEAANSLEYMTENFSLDSVHVLIILFCLIFGFKIIADSSDKYIKYFVDGSMGSADSSMHHMGTQAIAFAKSNLADPVARYAKDVVTHQSGRGIEALGNQMASSQKGGPKGAMTRFTGRVLQQLGKDIKDKPKKDQQAREDAKKQAKNQQNNPSSQSMTDRISKQEYDDSTYYNR